MTVTAGNRPQGPRGQRSVADGFRENGRGWSLREFFCLVHGRTRRMTATGRPTAVFGRNATLGSWVLGKRVLLHMVINTKQPGGR